MIIENHNINDFCTMITTCVFNKTKDIRLFISTSQINQQIKFTYVLFSPLYTAIYSDTVIEEEYNRIFSILEKCQDRDCNHDFRIQCFDNLSFNLEKCILTVGKETNVI